MNDRELVVLARLHVESLEDSLVTALGERYAREFYRYLTRSPTEIVSVVRDAEGHIVAAAVVSLEPGTLYSRLLRRTPLAWHVARRAFSLGRMAFEAWRRPRHPRDGRESTRQFGLPEMLLTFAAADQRGRGYGSAVVADVEARLLQRGVHEYQVRTVLDASNRALRFYGRLQFVPAGTARRLGTTFQLFTRRI